MTTPKPDECPRCGCPQPRSTELEQWVSCIERIRRVHCEGPMKRYRFRVGCRSRLLEVFDTETGLYSHRHCLSEADQAEFITRNLRWRPRTP